MTTRTEVETDVRAAVDRSEYKEAATRALDAFGPEVKRFLRARLRDATQADEAYLTFSEDLWIGLPAFRWESTLRVWMLTLARNAATRLARRRRKEVALPTDRSLVLQDAAERARTSTSHYLRTSVKERIRQLRGQLSDDDQTLLILRIDRRLEWRELAVIMSEVVSSAPEEELVRASSRMRTRFQTAKRRLRELARQDGLLGSSTQGDG